MNGLVAQDALVDPLHRVEAGELVSAIERPSRTTVFAVFESVKNTAAQGFLGIVGPQQLARATEKTFGELLASPSAELVVSTTTLPEVLKKLRVAGVEALPVVDENRAFLGAISQRSILDALLKRERELIKKSREFRQAVHDDQARRYESVRRLEQVNQAFKKLLGALARPPGLEVYQRGIEALSVVVEAKYGAVTMLEPAGGYREPITTGLAPGNTEGATDFQEQRRLLLEQVTRGNKIINIPDVPNYLRKQGHETPSSTMRSFLGVPISREGHVFGCAYVCDKEGSVGFTDDDEVLVASYASGLALGLAQSREVAQRRRAERERDMLANLGLRLATADTLEKLADTVRSVTDEFWRWDSFALSVRRSGKGKMEILAEIDYPNGRQISEDEKSPASEPKLPASTSDSTSNPPVRAQSGLNELLKAGQAVLINRSSDDPGPDLERFGDTSRESESMVFAPLHMEGNLMGVLSVQSYTPNRFQNSDRSLLQRMADAIGPALGRCQAERRSAAFVALGYHLSMATTPEEAAGIIVKTADALIGWSACSVYLYDAEEEVCTNVLHIDLVDGKREAVQPTMISAAPGVFSRKTIEEGPQLLLRTKPEFDGTTDPFGDMERASASLMFVPLRVGTRVTGILSIQSYESDAYEAGDLSLLQALADHCSGALERTRIMQSTLRETEVH